MAQIFNKTELAESILKSDEAKKIYNMVSPIYGNSYVALKIFQAQGKELDRAKELAEDVSRQLNPETATWLLPLWEERYGITPGADWTLERRREAVISKRKYNAPIVPKKMGALLSALIGVPVDIAENTGPNQFTVYIRKNVTVDKYANAIQFVDEAKLAHLIYNIEIAAEITASVIQQTAVAVATNKVHYVEVS